MAYTDVPMPLVVDTHQEINNSNNVTTRSRIRLKTTAAAVTDCHRCHRHSSSTSSAAAPTTPCYPTLSSITSSSSSSTCSFNAKSHRRRYSIQSSSTSSTSPSSATSTERSHSQQRRVSPHHSHGHSHSHHYQSPSTQLYPDHLHHHRSRTMNTGSLHAVPVVPSASFFRRIIKVFVGTTGSNTGSSADEQFMDPRQTGGLLFNSSQRSKTSGLVDSEPQTDESGSCEENDCICDDHYGDGYGDGYGYQDHDAFMAMSAPGPSSNSSVRQKKRSNSIASASTSASSTDNYSGGGRSSKNRPGRTGSIGGTSVRSSSTTNSTGTGAMTNRRSSITSSMTGESVCDYSGTSSSGSNGRPGDKGRRGSIANQQQYRQHFTGMGTFAPQGNNAAMIHQSQQDPMKRRLSFFKSMAANMAAGGASSRRGSAFSTTTAVNLTGITLPDEDDDADLDGEGGEDDDMESVDADSFDDDEDIDAYNDNDFNDYETDEDDHRMAVDEVYANGVMPTRDVELELHRHRRQDRARRSTQRQTRQLRRQSLLSDNNNLMYRNKTGGYIMFPPPLPEYAQRPTPIQLPEILHLIFQFVVDLTPQEDYSQREIYSCLLVSKQWYLVAQKTLWREIRIKSPDKLALFVDLLKRTDTVECLGIERNSQAVTSSQQQQQQSATSKTTPVIATATTTTITQQRPRRLSFLLKGQSGQQETAPAIGAGALIVAPAQQRPPLDEESIMAPSAMVKRLHERASAVKKIVLHKLKLIEDADVLPLTSWFHNLHIIEFYICEKLTDRIVISIAENCPQLQQLLMPGCAKVTDQGITQVALNCPRMRHLDLRACSNVSDESLILVARHCRDLWHLNVGRVSAAGRVTGKSIVELAKNTALNTLGLAGCAMTDDAVIEIARYSRSGLHRISLNSCPLLTSSSVRALMQLCPNLAVLEIKQCLLVTDMATLYRFSTRRVLVELCPELQKRLVDYKCELQAMNASIQSNNVTSAAQVAGGDTHGSSEEQQQQQEQHAAPPSSNTSTVAPH
ncbi:Antagonist of MEN (Mitotic Exit Network) [Linnemannia hyalina]|uniref:Antagonist of MEN (Mitotic Exit Network) n=1 Tax=Linnemannia hyalina TaxID=64524 RepID=A0A9P8BUN0_9FUNG|nr:Antagonist of MEN (Mitotic Exit Network) [Linnemannia hyalina]